MSPDDGTKLLEYFAKQEDRKEEIPPERHKEVVQWLGGNPRAIRVLIGSLLDNPLEDLIGVKPELWDTHDQEVSEDFIAKLEEALLEKTLSTLSKEYIIHLKRLALYRKPFKKEGIELLFQDKKLLSQFKREMAERFLIEQHKGWFRLHPTVREIMLRRFEADEKGFKQAHRIVVQYYTRHFNAKQMVGWGKHGVHYLEVRYHFFKAGEIDKNQSQKWYNPPGAVRQT